MGFQVQFGAGAQQGQGWQGDTHGSGQALLYDAAGNVLVYADKSKPAAVSGLMGMGLANGLIARANRVDDYSTARVTSEVMVFHDAFEGANINTLWTQSLTTMTAVQATGVLTLNNSNITTLNTDAIITCAKQFPKYPHQPLFCKFRGRITANVAANHTLVEMGVGAPVGTTAIINNGAFFRFQANGALVGVLSYNGTEQTISLAAQGSISTASYYSYEVIVDDDFVRFIVSDATDNPIIDTQLQLNPGVPFTFAVSHLPSFARVYVDGTGGGTAVQLLLSAHIVQLLDAATNQAWNDQLAGVNRYANINPTSYAGNSQAFGAAPALLTPANATVGYTTLGGEYNIATAVAAETPSCIFGFQIPTPYAFMLTGIFIPPPVVSVTIATTGVPYIEWMIAVNATTGTMSTGGGARQGIGIVHSATSAAAAQGATWTGVSNTWSPRVPILCLPGTFLDIGLKFLGATAAGTPGAHRGTVTVDGYFM